MIRAICLPLPLWPGGRVCVQAGPASTDRAQSGLGTTAVETDINPVISVPLKELKARESHHDRLIIRSPSGGWLSQIDPNALGIMLNIHFENALKHTRGDMPVHVDASQMGRVVISNDCDTLAPEDLDVIKQRFNRKGPMSDGYCLGLSIVHELCNHSGCPVELISPQSGKQRGSTAILNIPLTRE